jgi:hypothetical protein
LIDHSTYDFQSFAEGIGKDSCSKNAPLFIDEPMDPIDDINIIIDKIVNLGKKVWNVIELGRPVVNIKTDIATAMPQGARCWMDLARWKNPESKTYKVTFENGFGAEVVSFEYRIVYLYGGEVKGKGKYIGYTTTVPANIRVQFGFNLELASNVPTVYNLGSNSNPVGGLQMDLKWKVSTVMTDNRGASSFTIDGNGNFKKLN